MYCAAGALIAPNGNVALLVAGTGRDTRLLAAWTDHGGRRWRLLRLVELSRGQPQRIVRSRIVTSIARSCASTSSL